jgi:hypothetical protein
MNTIKLHFTKDSLPPLPLDCLIVFHMCFISCSHDVHVERYPLTHLHMRACALTIVLHLRLFTLALSVLSMASATMMQLEKFVPVKEFATAVDAPTELQHDVSGRPRSSTFTALTMAAPVAAEPDVTVHQEDAMGGLKQQLLSSRHTQVRASCFIMFASFCSRSFV